MKRKRQIPYLPDPLFSFENTCVAMLKTSYINFELVMAMNRAYKLDLAHGVNNMEIEGKTYPYFKYEDEDKMLTYILIDKPYMVQKDRVFDYYDKLLLVRGRDAWDFMKILFQHLTSLMPKPDEYDLLGTELLNNVNWLKEGIFDINIYRFSSTDQVETTAGIGETSRHSARIPSYVSFLKQFLEEGFVGLMSVLCEEAFSIESQPLLQQTEEDEAEKPLVDESARRNPKAIHVTL